MVAKLKLFDIKEKPLNEQEIKIKELILRRRLQILVHSCIYYRLNTNMISDSTFDEWSKELVELQRKYPKISKLVKYYDSFKDFDGSSGFDLPYGEPWVLNKAQQLLGYGGETL